VGEPYISAKRIKIQPDAQGRVTPWEVKGITLAVCVGGGILRAERRAPHPKVKRVNISPRHRMTVVARPRVSEEDTDAAEGRKGRTTLYRLLQPAVYSIPDIVSNLSTKYYI
jgi:hypothetical protein